MHLASLIVAALAGPGGPNGAQPANYQQDVLKWRQEEESGLRRDIGWLTLAGLFWLKEGENALGSSTGSAVRLPLNTPAKAGRITLHQGKVNLELESGVEATCNGEKFDSPAIELRSDASGTPDRIAIGSATFTVIERGKRIGIRLWDRENKTRKDFTGRKWYPIDAKYRVVATFVPYSPPKKIAILNVLGDVSMADSPGYVTFQWNGKKCRLDAEPDSEGLFFNFQDRTSGKTTYGAGRFLDAPKPSNGKVILDFNRATCPPCAFTSFATCPLPPKGNRLPVPIAAGEKKYHD